MKMISVLLSSSELLRMYLVSKISESRTTDTQRELFFKNSQLLGLGRQIELKFLEAFGVFSAKLLVLFWHCEFLVHRKVQLVLFPTKNLGFRLTHCVIHNYFVLHNNKEKTLRQTFLFTTYLLSTIYMLIRSTRLFGILDYCQVGIFFHTPVPFLRNFVNKKVGNLKN